MENGNNSTSAGENFCCSECGKREAGADSLRKCGTCKSRQYCNKECQRKHWQSAHKSECEDLRVASIHRKECEDLRVARHPVFDPNAPLSVSDIVTQHLWDNDERIVAQGMKVLAELCSNEKEEEKRQMAGLIGAPIIIIKSMDKFSRNVEIHENGTEALWSMTRDDVVNTVILKVGGVERIVATMTSRFHDDNSEIQAYGCGSLANLSFVPNKDKFFKLVIECGAITAILSAMKKFKLDSVIQRVGCIAFRSFAEKGGEVVKDAIVNAGGLVVVSNAIKHHSEDLLVKDTALKTAYVLSSENADYRDGEGEAPEALTLADIGLIGEIVVPY